MRNSARLRRAVLSGSTEVGVDLVPWTQYGSARPSGAWSKKGKEMALDSETSIDFADPNLVAYPSDSARWVAMRKQAFEGEVSLRDPWAVSFGGHEAPTSEFQVSPAELLRRAHEQPPEQAAPSVAAFADWVYSLYRRGPSLQGMARGRAAEKLWDGGLKYDASFGDVSSSLWQLAYRGMGEIGESAPPFSAPTLQVRGEPLRCRPDLVYRHRYASCAVIVEVKCTSKPIPRSLWPNVWAQLWAYSKIEEFAKLERIVVLAEIWAEHGSRIILRRMVRRDPRREPFDRFYCELFNSYQNHLS